MKLAYIAVFYPFEEQNGYTVEFPDLPGCITQGDSLEEAFVMASDAASGWILGEIEDGNSIPEPSRNINLDEFEGAAFSNYCLLDMDEYAKKYSQKAVKKTLTIPRWINSLAEKNDINFSRVLQKALLKELHLTSDSLPISNYINDTELIWMETEIYGRINTQSELLFSDKNQKTSSKIINFSEAAPSYLSALEM